MGSDSNAPNRAREPGVAVVVQAAELPATKIRTSMKSAKRVVVATMNDPALLAMSIAATADGIVRDRIIADLSVTPVSAITILSPSGSRVSEAVKTFTPKDVQAQLQTARIGHCNSFDPFCPEGAHILKEYLKPGTCVVAYVEYKNLKRDEATGVLAHLNAAVEQADAFVVIFVVCTKKQDTSWLRAYAGEFVEITKCEPGPGAQTAIVFTNVSLVDHHALGIGRVMIEAFVDSGGTYTYRSEPFIADRAIIRFAWCARNKEAKIEQIAALVGRNKSNVSRGLDDLLVPPNNEVGMKPPKGSRNRWATLYNLDEVWPLKSPDAGVAGEATNTPHSPKTGDSGHAAKAPPMTNCTNSLSSKTLP
ncbi:hypothetical protein [Paraburkholderia sp. BL21I4N1]|uniref:hypothetical protein n=1 Tax=Paraburkholderia sp. BL21I4N1 TaxID=1938801 RepID=UPI0011B240AE|nr:hypothetical protein [Paraburkholderia sp. BL21I4N1]